MLTIKTSVIEKGSFRERLWNVLDKIYNPHKIGVIARWSDKQKELTEQNEAPFTKLEVFRDRYDSMVIFSKIPEVNTEIDSSTKKESLYFEQPATFTPDGQESNPYYLERYPVLCDRVHYVYVWQHTNKETGSAEVNYVAYFKKHGWANVDDYISADTKKVTANVVFDKEIKKECESLKKKVRFFDKIGRGIYKFLHTIDSTILCIRFPFLYPRNRFTGRHYNNWKLLEYIDKKKKEAVAFLNIRVNKDEKIPNFDNKFPDVKKKIVFKNKFIEKCEYYVVWQNTEYLVYKKDTGCQMICVTDTENWSGTRNYVYSVDMEKWIDVTNYLENKDGDLEFEHDDHINLYRTIILDKKKKFYVDFLQWFHNYVLSLIFCLPTYNELDAMDEGWMRAFGIDICKDVRKCLIKNGGFKLLFKYRITQIKEKFGGLRWYDAGCPRELYDVIGKYENISFHTCICCGKPAKYITSGWICPYCEDCISDSGKEGATIIDENGKEHSPRENAEEQCGTTNTEENSNEHED